MLIFGVELLEGVNLAFVRRQTILLAFQYFRVPIICVLLTVYLSHEPVLAAMQSDSYKVGPDVLNEAGGPTSSSSYRMWINFGESVTGVSSSENYVINAGFWTNEQPILLFTLSANSLNLGTLSTSTVSSANLTLSVSTSAIHGYRVTAQDNTSVGTQYGMIDGTRDINDATTPNTYIDLPLAGFEHYGITAYGSAHVASGYAGGTKINSMDNTNVTEVASHTGVTSGDNITVEYRASISSTSPASMNYQTITTYVCTGLY